MKLDKKAATNGYYGSTSHVKKESGTSYALKRVLVAAVILIILGAGYIFVAGNPFEQHSASQPAKPKVTQPAPKPKSTNKTIIKSDVVSSKQLKININDVYENLNNIANGYGDTNDNNESLAHYFVDGSHNSFYKKQDRWANNELGNRRVQSVELHPSVQKVNGRTVSYVVKSSSTLPNGKTKTTKGNWKINFNKDGKIISIRQQK